MEVAAMRIVFSVKYDVPVWDFPDKKGIFPDFLFLFDVRQDSIGI